MIGVKFLLSLKAAMQDFHTGLVQLMGPFGLLPFRQRLSVNASASAAVAMLDIYIMFI
jgi:hypothetical protein